MPISAKDDAARGEQKVDTISTGATKETSEQKSAAPTAGHIVRDSRGNAVWSWGKGSDTSATGSTSTMLRKLDLGGLRMEDEAQSEKPAGAKKRGSGYGPGYNPYDRTAPVRVAPPKKEPSR